MRQASLTLSLVLLFAHTGLMGAEAATAAGLSWDKALKDYVKADAAGRREILAALGEGDAFKSAADVKSWTKKILAEAGKAAPAMKPEKTDLLAKLDAKRQQFNKMLGIGSEPVATVETPAGAMRVVVLGDKAKNAPVLIYLHGGGNVGGDHPGELDNEMAWGWGLKRAGMVKSIPFKLLPRCLDDKAVNAWVLANEARAVEAVLDTALKRYDLDPDRVYLAGTSMGGFGAWNFAALLGDRFTAVASLGGGCTCGNFELANLRNLHFGVFIGEQDTAAGRLAGSRKGRDILQALKGADADGYSLAYKEYGGAGHNLPDSAYADVDAFFKGKERNAAPRVVVWHPLVSWKTRFYNLGVDAPGKGMEIRAEMAADNTVTVTSAKVEALTVFLNDRLVDFKKPVKVVWNGKEAYAAPLAQRFSVLLETLADRGDPEVCYRAKVVLKP